jgi:O-succinylbenzoic acid--CoA ligase
LPELTAALGDALSGGAPVAPLPSDPVEQQRVRAVLQPDRPVTEPGAAVLVSTSGSTGEPKGVVLSAAAIQASASATHEHLGGPGHWLLALPPHYVAGLMVAARAVASEQPVSRVGSDLAELPTVLDRSAGERHYLSLVPTQLRRALDDPRLAEALGRVDAVLLGGAAAPADLLAAAAGRGITVVTTYGMSETCGGCVYGGTPLPGVRLTLEPDTGIGSHRPAADHQQGDRQEGRILLGGPMVFSGYRLRPDLTDRVLVDGAVRTNDRGRIVDGRLQVLGRYDDVIISGGLKIDAAAVERAARDWPALAGADIVMVGVPDPEWGSRLVAYTESGSGTDPEPAGLRAYLGARFARHELPTELIVLDRLPRTSSGKVDRERLRRGPTGRDTAAATAGVPAAADRSRR